MKPSKQLDGAGFPLPLSCGSGDGAQAVRFAQQASLASESSYKAYKSSSGLAEIQKTLSQTVEEQLGMLSHTVTPAPGSSISCLRPF